MAATSHLPVLAVVNIEPSSSSIARLLRRLKGQSNGRPTSSHTVESSSVSSSLSDPKSAEKTANIKSDVYREEGLQEFYVPIASYEGRHRYDPTAQWTEKEERSLIRRLDYKICSWVCFMFFALQLDRGNIGQALSDNLLSEFIRAKPSKAYLGHILEDLHLTTNDYNLGMTLYFHFKLTIHSQLISKRIGPDNWIPIQMCLWSIVTSCQSRITGRSTFYLTRALLGMCEGGFVPDVILYLTYFYKSSELPLRLSFFYGAYILTSIVSAFMAFGILHLAGVYGMAGWQWLFAIEGAITALIGIISYFYLPPSPTQTASFFRGKNGWFSEREEIIMVNRILRDDPSKGDMHNREAVGFTLLWKALTDYDMWPIYILGLTWSIPGTPATNYLTLTLRAIGFDTFITNLLTIPAFALFFCQLIFWTWLSEKINNRFLIVVVCQVWFLPLLIALEFLPGGKSEQWARYAINVMLVGYPYIQAILVALTSRNAGSVRTRTVGSAIYNMTVQASQIISANIYRTSDAPLYRYGNKVLLAIVAVNFVMIGATKMYYMRRNSARAKVWDGMDKEQRETYLRTTKHEGNKRLDFRFAH
ncbi:hypothetical protein MMC12_006782 [Toensbergia leucococca]|nr:hypothetical protein [Toensbergia leucococca]